MACQALLTFHIQNSVPHLKTRLQLQQAIMKELLQRQERDKCSPSTPTPTTTASPVFPAGSTVTKAIVIGEPAATKTTSAMSTSTVSSTSTTDSNMSVGSLVLQPALIAQLNSQLPKAVRDQIAKLPPDQQKMVYLHHLKRLQVLRQQMQSRQTAPTTSSTTVEQIQRAQEQLVKEQQVPLTVTSRSSASKMPTNKTSFSNLKLMGSSSSISSSSNVSPSKGKKSKGKGKDLSVDE